MAVAGQARRDRDAVRAAPAFLVERGHDRPVRGRAAVESGELLEVGALDVAADAALGEGQRHPGLEAGQHARPDLGMGGEVEIEAGRPGVHQPPQPGGRAAIIGPELGRVDPQPLAQILPERALALGFGEPAESGQIIGLDPVEVVLGLGIDRAEHRVGVGRPADMGDAPIVAGDRDPRRLRPPGGAARPALRRDGRGEEKEQKREQPAHEAALSCADCRRRQA